MSSSEAFVTLAMDDGYALGALVLAQSIRKVGTKRNLVVLISNHVSDFTRFRFDFSFNWFENGVSFRKSLEKNFDKVVLVHPLNPIDKEHKELLSRSTFLTTYTKINCWLLFQYSKCVFIAAGCLALRAFDDLFYSKQFSAVLDRNWVDFFNTEVFVFEPSQKTFDDLMKHASENDALFDGWFLFRFLLSHLLLLLCCRWWSTAIEFILYVLEYGKYLSTFVNYFQRRYEYFPFIFIVGEKVNPK